MIRLPPRPTLQYSVFPDTTLLRSVAIGFRLEVAWTIHLEPMASASWLWVLQHRAGVAVETSRSPCFVRPMDAAGGARAVLHPEIGRAHVCTPVTNAHLVCRLMLDKKKQHNRRNRTINKDKQN